MSVKRRQKCADSQSLDLPSRLLRVAVVLGTAVVLAALAAPASAHQREGRQVRLRGRLRHRARLRRPPNSLQVIISRDGKPATDLAGQLDKLKAHLYYGGKVDPKAEMVELPLDALRRRLGDAG